MKLPFKRALIFIFLLLVLCACSTSRKVNENKDITQPQQSNGSQKTTTANKNIKADPLPTTYEELANLPVGENGNDYFVTLVKNEKEIAKIIKELPSVSSNPSEKELDYFYREVLKKFQKDYEGPEKAIRNLKFQSLGDPNLGDSRYQFKDHLNVEIILDASGSMIQSINGKTKMESAKDSIVQFVNKLPKDAKVGIRVYGHKGSSSDSDKILSCSSSEIVYPISNYNEGTFKSALNKFSPNGWTPIGLALNEAKKDLANYDGKNNTNIVYLVSDGIDTCDDDPIKAAKELFNSNVSPIINVIGFDADNAGQNQLKQIADATQGIYETVNNESDLQKELDKLNHLTEQWSNWREKGKVALKSKKINNSLDIFSYITEEEVKATGESSNIYLFLAHLYQSHILNTDSFHYLDLKNSEYHKWIKGEIDKFNKELKDLNEKSYTEALKELEEKYKKNTQ